MAQSTMENPNFVITTEPAPNTSIPGSGYNSFLLSNKPGNNYIPIAVNSGGNSWAFQMTVSNVNGGSITVYNNYGASLTVSEELYVLWKRI